MELSVNESISTLTNRSKCSLVAFDHIYRTCTVLLSEVERMPSYSAVAVDGTIYFKNTEIICCSGISVNESISTLRNRSKCSIVAFDHIYHFAHSISISLVLFLLLLGVSMVLVFYFFIFDVSLLLLLVITSNRSCVSK